MHVIITTHREEIVALCARLGVRRLDPCEHREPVLPAAGRDFEGTALRGLSGRPSPGHLSGLRMSCTGRTLAVHEIEGVT